MRICNQIPNHCKKCPTTKRNNEVCGQNVTPWNINLVLEKKRTKMQWYNRLMLAQSTHDRGDDIGNVSLRFLRDFFEIDIFIAVFIDHTSELLQIHWILLTLHFPTHTENWMKFQFKIFANFSIAQLVWLSRAEQLNLIRTSLSHRLLVYFTFIFAYVKSQHLFFIWTVLSLLWYTQLMVLLS